MVQNSLYPGFVKLNYKRGAITHTATLPVLPQGVPTVGTEPSFFQKNGTAALMSTLVNAFVTVWRPFLFTDMDIQSADYWSVPGPDGDPVWIYSHLIGLQGSGTGSTAAAGEAVMSFRTDQGGLLKIYWMEPYAALLTVPVQSYPFPAGGTTTFANYMLGGTSWVVGRDGGAPAVPIKFTTKTNDALRRKLYLLS